MPAARYYPTCVTLPDGIALICGGAWTRLGNKSNHEYETFDWRSNTKLNPKHVPSYDKRGSAYRGQEKYEQAIADCTEAIKLDPDGAGHYYNRGITYRRLGRNNEAIVDLRTCLELDPEPELRNRAQRTLASLEVQE